MAVDPSAKYKDRESFVKSRSKRISSIKKDAEERRIDELRQQQKQQSAQQPAQQEQGQPGGKSLFDQFVETTFGIGKGIVDSVGQSIQSTGEIINEATGRNAATARVLDDARKNLTESWKSGKLTDEQFQKAIQRVSDTQAKFSSDLSKSNLRTRDRAQVAGDVTSLALDVGTLGAAGAVRRGVTEVAKQSLGKRVAKEAAEGAAIGAGYGAAQAARDKGEKATGSDIAQGAAVGAGFGAVGGAAIPVVGAAIRKFKEPGKLTGDYLNKSDGRIRQTINRIAEPMLQSSPALRTRDLFSQARVKFVRSEEPILNVLKAGEKKGKLDAGTARRVETLMRDVKTADQQAEFYMRDNQNWTNVIQGLDKSGIQDMAKYAEARAELDLISRGAKKDGGRSEKFQEILLNAPEEYGQRYDSLVKYYSDLRERLVESGLVSREQADAWARVDPDYVHIQRELDNVSNRQPGQGSGIASIRSTAAKQKRGESVAETKNLLEVAVGRTTQLEREMLRNKAANELVDSLAATRDLFGDEILSPVTGSAKNRPTISRRVNGQEEVYQTLPEIEAAAKSWDQVPLGAIGRIMAAPTRVLRATLTGPLNPAFILKSAVRDPVESFVLSRSARATHSPANIIGGLADAAGKSDLFKEYLRTEGSSTMTDVLRKPKDTARQLREQARLTKPSLQRKAEVIRTPSQWWRKWEDITKAQEQVARYQNFRGAYNDAIKRGANKEAALVEARWAARNNMVDFYQTGDWSKIANAIWPYFNPSVQGGMRLARAFKENPVATSAKVVTAIQIPTVLATMYNLSDPRRAEIYMDIPEYERQNNWIFILPGTEKSGDRWGVIKIPKPAGVGALSNPVEKMTASMYGHDPVQFGDFVQAVLKTGSPFDTSSPTAFVGSVIPQQIRPFVQDAANKDFFLNRDIVPSWLKEQEKDAFAQHFENTPEAAKKIGEWLGISPLRVQSFVKSTLGEAGQYALGERTPAETVGRTFTSAAGGERQGELRDAFSGVVSERSGISKQITEALKSDQIVEADRLAAEFNQRLDDVAKMANKNKEFAKLTEKQEKILDTLKFAVEDGKLTSRSIKSRLKD